jgi:hypothetical protein
MKMDIKEVMCGDLEWVEEAQILLVISCSTMLCKSLQVILRRIYLLLGNRLVNRSATYEPPTIAR